MVSLGKASSQTLKSLGLRIVPEAHRKRYKSRDSRGILPGKRHISERPAEVETRLQLGHWEGDTVIGSDLHHCILTLVERKSGFAIIKKLASRTADSVNLAALDAIKKHQGNFKTITFDNGTEFHGYKALEQQFPLKCYFATPYHSWERGSNENLNGLIRQYIPKRASMEAVTQTYCDAVARRLNFRPRKRHGYKSPQEIYYGSHKPLHFDLELRPPVASAGPLVQRFNLRVRTSSYNHFYNSIILPSGSRA